MHFHTDKKENTSLTKKKLHDNYINGHYIICKMSTYTLSRP